MLMSPRRIILSPSTEALTPGKSLMALATASMKMGYNDQCFFADHGIEVCIVGIVFNGRVLSYVFLYTKRNECQKS
jgi:hypothetical protein